MTNNTKQSIVAFIRLACMFVTSIATMAGIALDASVLYICVSSAATMIAFIWGWWKNNNVTTAATEAQEFLDMLKANSIRSDLEETEG